jgi:ferritin-like metal-binding protein YciE
MKDFYKLFENELKDMYSSEQQIVKALPKVIKRGFEHAFGPDA